ncbi:hypothetical protein ACF0H5_000113 [Mactra antiquata]
MHSLNMLVKITEQDNLVKTVLEYKKKYQIKNYLFFGLFHLFLQFLGFFLLQGFSFVNFKPSGETFGIRILGSS